MSISGDFRVSATLASYHKHPFRSSFPSFTSTSKEEIRDMISVLEAELLRESEKSASSFSRIEKYREARRELDRKLDTLYQRKIAEALDDHLTAIQRDHELKSQIEERKIRSDAAHEEAKRREKSIQEERLRQERAKAEAEVLVAIQAALTVIGNATMCFAAYRIHKSSKEQTKNL